MEFIGQLIDYTINCASLNLKETICMICQIIFSGKHKKNLISLSSAESPHIMLSVKLISAAADNISISFCIVQEKKA